MSVKFSNNAKTTLSSSISSSATSIAVADASVFPSISGSEYFYVTFEDLSGNVEIVKVTGVSSNTLTVTRGQESTTARSFSSGDKAENRLTAGGLNDVATQADTDTNTTYSAGSGLSLSGTTFSNTAPDQTVSLSGSGATSVSGTYPNFTITSTDTNTTYTVGDGGLTQNNFTNALKSKLDGIEASADVTDTANVVGALTGGTNVTIASDGTISASGGVDGISSAATSNAIHIDSASRVSFGTTSPFTATVAQVYQSDNTTYSGLGFNYQVGDGGLVVQNNSTTTNSMAGISFVNGTNTTTGSGTAAYGMWNNYSIQTSSSGKSDLVWTTKTPGGTVFEAMRLTGNGVFSSPRLGIGTNSPTATLDVDGDINADGDVDAENYKINGSQGSDGQVLTSTGSGVAWEDAAGGVDGISSAATSNAMHIDSSGRIGFGTTNPSAWYYDDFVFTSGNAGTSITIAGTNATGGESQIMFSDGSSGSSSYTGFIKYAHNQAAGGTGPSLTTDWMAFGTNAQQRVRIDNAGKVGIGNNYSPSEMLDVNGTVRATNYKIGSDQGTDGQVLTSTGSGVAWEAPAGPTGYSSTGDNITLSADADNNHSSTAIKFLIDGSEKSRLTHHGSLLLQGLTSEKTYYLMGSADGIQLGCNDGSFSAFTRSHGAPLIVARRGSKNDLQEFRYDTTVLGRLGLTDNSSLGDVGFYVSGGLNSESAIRLEGTINAMTPAQDSAGKIQRANNALDLGYSDARWKDFYLGNDISHRDSGGTARTLYDRSADTLGNSSTNVTAATVDGTNFKVNGGQGTDGQVLTSTGSGVAWEDASGGLPPNIAGLSSGRYYTGMLDTTGSSNFTLPTTSLNYYPFIVPEDCTIDELTVIINGGTGNSGDVAQIAVYGPMPANVGSTPHKITSSTFAVNSGYGKSVAITATTFTAGIYFFAMAANTSSLTVRAFQDMEQHIPYMVGVNNYSFNGGLQGNQYAINTVSTWPHSFPTSISVTAATHSLPARPQFKYGVQ